MNPAGDLLVLLRRHLRSNLKTPIWAIINLTYPVVWLLLFGQLFGSMARTPGFPPGSYQTFIAPGVIVMTVIYGASFAALGLIMDLRLRVIERYLATPVSRPAIIWARILDATINVTAQACLMLLLSLIVGVRFHTILGPIQVIVAAAALGFVFAAFSILVGIRSRHQQGLVGMMNIIIVPLIFCSTALLPRSLAPGWLQRLMPYNPVTWAIDLARAATTSATALTGLDLLARLGGLLVLGLALTILATHAFRRWQETL